MDAGWKIEEVGKVVTQDGEDRDGMVEIDTTEGEIEFFTDIRDGMKGYDTQTTYILPVTYTRVTKE